MMMADGRFMTSCAINPIASKKFTDDQTEKALKRYEATLSVEESVMEEEI